jgi:hypothetical protein
MEMPGLQNSVPNTLHSLIATCAVLCSMQDVEWAHGEYMHRPIEIIAIPHMRVSREKTLLECFHKSHHVELGYGG